MIPTTKAPSQRYKTDKLPHPRIPIARHGARPKCLLTITHEEVTPFFVSAQFMTLRFGASLMSRFPCLIVLLALAIAHVATAGGLAADSDSRPGSPSALGE